MAKTGRPRALNDDKRGQICGLVASGCALDHAARHVGCSVRTIRRETVRNPAFGESLRRAELSAQLQPLNSLRAAASKNWRAAAWLLERTKPDQFARRDPSALTPDALSAAIDNILEAIVDEIDDADIRGRVYRRILAISTREQLETAAARHNPNRPRRIPDPNRH